MIIFTEVFKSFENVNSIDKMYCKQYQFTFLVNYLFLQELCPFEIFLSGENCIESTAMPTFLDNIFMKFISARP